MSYIHPHDSGRQWAGVGVVVVLHVVLVYALTNGLARQSAVLVQAPLEANIIEEPKPLSTTPPAALPPPLTQPANQPRPAFVPPPDVQRHDAPIPSDAAVSHDMPIADAPTPLIRPLPSVASSAAPVRTKAVVDSRRCEKPQYPRESLRANESGRVGLQFLIGTDGTALESKIEKSSGFSPLDEAARRALSLCQFKPGTENGQPVPSWAKIDYLWKVED